MIRKLKVFLIAGVIAAIGITAVGVQSASAVTLVATAKADNGISCAFSYTRTASGDATIRKVTVITLHNSSSSAKTFRCKLNLEVAQRNITTTSYYTVGAGKSVVLKPALMSYRDQTFTGIVSDNKLAPNHYYAGVNFG